MKSQIDLLKEIKNNTGALARIETFIKNNTVDVRNFNSNEDFTDWQNDMFKRCHEVIKDVKKLYKVSQQAIELYLSLDIKFFIMFSHKQQNAISNGLCLSPSTHNKKNLKGLGLIQEFSHNSLLSKFMQDNIDLLPSNTKMFVIAKSGSCEQTLNMKTIDNSFEAKAFSQQLDSKFSKKELQHYYDFFSQRKIEEALPSLYHFQNSLLSKYPDEKENVVFKEFHSLIISKIAFLFNKLFDNVNSADLKCAKLIVDGCFYNFEFKNEFLLAIKDINPNGECVAVLSSVIDNVKEIGFLEECLAPHLQNIIRDKFFNFNRLSNEAKHILSQEYIEQFFIEHPVFLFKEC